MKTIAIISATVLFLVSAALSAAASDILTLDQSIKIALERSLSLRAAEEEIKSKEFEERSARADFYPKLSTYYSYTRIDTSTVNDATYTTYVYSPPSSFTPKQVATSTDVLDAQTLLAHARSNYFNALSEHDIALAQLERAMGTGFKGSEVPHSKVLNP